MSLVPTVPTTAAGSATAHDVRSSGSAELLVQPLMSTHEPPASAPGVSEAMSLGATMYAPILHPAIRDIISGQKYPKLKSVVLCLEDALHAANIDEGLRRLKALLDDLDSEPAIRAGQPWLFVRPRNLDMAERICALRGIDRVNGLVIPKLKIEDLADWWRLAELADLRLMPTLERAWVLDPAALHDFIAVLERQSRHRLVALRVGGNDLLATMQLRRVRGETIYDGPLAWGLSQLMCQLGARGYPLTAPVFDVLNDPDTLRRECERDAAFGFVGKTAIHPDQIEVIQNCFAVSRDDVKLAYQTLEPDAEAVFQAAGVMIEPATHQGWAHRILARARVYGIVDEPAIY